MPTVHVPKSICLLRLSALGDVTHMLPIIHTLQQQWPQTKITWIVGKFEYKLVCNLPNIEFIVFDKSQGWRAYTHLKKQLAKRRFDILLNMQVALRANLATLFIKADTRVGYDKHRSKDLHGLFINSRIPPQNKQHVVDAFFSFLSTIGIDQNKHTYNWNIPIPQNAYDLAKQHIDNNKKTLIISPCSSHSLRNWQAKSYAQVADYAIQKKGMQVIICGGPSQTERQMGNDIIRLMQEPPLDLIGKDTIQQFLALLDKADMLISPDSGPAHMATCVGTPVIGLYAASNLQRSGPYLSRKWSIDQYPQASQKFLKQDVTEIKWGTKIELAGVMTLIKPEDVIQKIDILADTL